MSYGYLRRSTVVVNFPVTLISLNVPVSASDVNVTSWPFVKTSARFGMSLSDVSER